MKRISAEAVAKAREFVYLNSTPLAKAKFDYRLRDGRREPVLNALAAYQNGDGGFGHALEPDFLLPDSSPMATSIAFQTFHELDLSSDHEMVRKGVDYLLASYDKSAGKWATVPPAVNDYPHAIWWHYDEEGAGTALDASWGNPTAELIGYLERFSGEGREPFMDELYTRAIDYLIDYQDKMEMHELYCYQRFAQQIRPAHQARVEGKLADLVALAVSTDPEAWHGYSAQPLDFIKSPEDDLADQYEEALEANLDFWIDSLSPEGVWFPSWSWGQFEASWREARIIIAGLLTVDRLTILNRFGRLHSYS